MTESLMAAANDVVATNSQNQAETLFNLDPAFMDTGFGGPDPAGLVVGAQVLGRGIRIYLAGLIRWEYYRIL